MLRFRFQCLWTSVWFIDEFKPDLWDLTRMSVSSSASKASLAAETEDNSWGSSPKHKAWRNTFCNKGAFLFYFFFKESALLGPKLSNAESSQNWTECTELLVSYNFLYIDKHIKYVPYMLNYERLPYNVCNYNFQQQNCILNIFILTSVKYLMYLKCVNFLFCFLYFYVCI